jgi:hypothetical protein
LGTGRTLGSGDENKLFTLEKPGKFYWDAVYYDRYNPKKTETL